MADILVSNPLQRSQTLPMSRDSRYTRGSWLPIDHFLGGLAGYHYVAFTKINPRGHSHPLGFSSLISTVPLPAGGVTDKSKTNEPRHPASAEHVLCLDPIDSTMAKPTTPQVPLTNPLGASHTTLMVELFSRMIIEWTGPYEEVLEKQPESPLVPQVHHHIQNNIIVS
jgi:hypothetical protein